jgi:hypothetical protein
MGISKFAYSGTKIKNYIKPEVMELVLGIDPI